MRITECFNQEKGHVNLEFVDIDANRDTTLFIDPCLIEVGTSSFCVDAANVMKDYFNGLYSLYKNHCATNEKLNYYQHCHEINATKLGYGSGSNGKAKTALGMVETLRGLQELVDANLSLEKAIDLPIFIRDFAEDCLSDMLTNILFLQLSKFTVYICKKHSYPLKKVNSPHYYWDMSDHTWKEYDGEGMLVDGKLVLLVPKDIVRHNYYYNADQYFRSVILERMQEERTTYDTKGKAIKPSKKSIKAAELRSHTDVLDILKAKTIEQPTLLDLHHQRLNSSYSERTMSDEDLDYWVYKRQ